MQLFVPNRSNDPGAGHRNGPANFDGAIAIVSRSIDGIWAPRYIEKMLQKLERLEKSAVERNSATAEKYVSQAQDYIFLDILSFTPKIWFFPHPWTEVYLKYSRISGMKCQVANQRLA